MRHDAMGRDAVVHDAVMDLAGGEGLLGFVGLCCLVGIFCLAVLAVGGWARRHLVSFMTRLVGGCARDEAGVCGRGWERVFSSRTRRGGMEGRKGHGGLLCFVGPSCFVEAKWLGGQIAHLRASRWRGLCLLGPCASGTGF